jgi:hypothetical protein
MDAPVVFCTARSTSPKVEFSARILSNPSRKVTCGGVASVWAGREPKVWAGTGCCPAADGSADARVAGVWPSRAGAKPASRIEAHTNLALILIPVRGQNRCTPKVRLHGIYLSRNWPTGQSFYTCIAAARWSE